MTIPIPLDGSVLGFSHLGRIGAGCAVAPSAEGMDRVRHGRAILERGLASGQPIYGTNTGVGGMKDKDWRDDELAEFNLGLVRSHHFGTGAPFPNATVRKAIAIRINTALTGTVGCSPQLVDAFVDLLNADIIPIVRRTGSIGCADIGLMGQIGAVLTGVGEVSHRGARRDAAEVLAELGRAPLVFAPRDALAALAVNAIGYAAAAVALRSAARAVRVLMAVGLFSSATLGASRAPWRSAAHIGTRMQTDVGRWLCEASRDWPWHDASNVQDPLSLRMMPQIFGTTLSTLMHAGQAVLNMTARSDDNPVVVEDEVLTSGGSLPADVAIVVQSCQLTLAHIARNVFNRCVILVSGGRRGLPVNLVPEGVVATGFGPALKLMGDLYMRVLSMTAPLSPQSLVVANGAEDEAAFLPLIVERLERQVRALWRMAALEALLAAQAADVLDDGSEGLALQIRGLVRRHSAFYRADRPLSSEVEEIETEISSSGFILQLVDLASVEEFDRFFAISSDVAGGS
ncbi:histidine ammonia-lyase [Aureimonas flava]|uniref:Histidine ammonia-lyase n=1 Tax=Aureimonas flava TaxID=2320271 RepID=A0A3A1WKA8_9HYPH|nr:aromatic amino acid lyase [Aureimonas flava]RIX99694.1 histidine ammonia-lyase [Aureimonas flava]